MKLKVKGPATLYGLPGGQIRSFVPGDIWDVPDDDTELVAWAKGFAKAGGAVITATPAKTGDAHA